MYLPLVVFTAEILKALPSIMERRRGARKRQTFQTLICPKLVCVTQPEPQICKHCRRISKLDIQVTWLAGEEGGRGGDIGIEAHKDFRKLYIGQVLK